MKSFWDSSSLDRKGNEMTRTAPTKRANTDDQFYLTTQVSDTRWLVIGKGVNDIHPYVSWLSDAYGNCDGGRYRETYIEALETHRKRCEDWGVFVDEERKSIGTGSFTHHQRRR